MEKDELVTLALIGLLAVALVAGLVVLVRFLLGRRRTKALAELAGDMGWSFVADGRCAFDLEIFLTSHLFQHRQRPKIRNLLSHQEHGVSAVLFDYAYLVGNGRRTWYEWQTVAATQWAGVFFPDFFLEPRGLLGRLLPGEGTRNITLPTNPSFTTRYQLRGHSEEVVRDFFCDEVIAAIRRSDNLCIEGGGQWLMMYRPKDSVAPRHIPAFHNKAMKIARAMVQRCIPAPRR